MKKKILIINAHSFKNKGDAAIVISMIESIKRHNCYSEITVLSRDSKEDQIYLNYGANSVKPSLINFYQDISSLKKVLFFLKELILIIFSIGYKKKIMREYEKSDVVVSCGGAFLYSKNVNKFELTILNHFIQIFYAIRLRKPIIIYSQSIGPFKNKFMRWVAKNILKHVKVIFVREEVSLELLNRLGILNVKLSADAAFNLSVENINLDNLICKNEQYMAVTVRQWGFPGNKNKEELYSNYIKGIAELINYAYKNYNYKALLVPQVIGPNIHEDDRIAFKSLIENLADTNSINEKLLNFDFTPGQIKQIYKSTKMLVGTRMHSNIFALSENIPVLAIAYEHKTNGIMKMYDMPNLVFNIDDIKKEELIKGFEYIKDNFNELKDNLNNKNKKVKVMSEYPALEIYDILNHGWK